MKTYFNGIKEGDKIWTIQLGYCRVDKFCPDSDAYKNHPIFATNGGNYHWYQMSGKLDSQDKFQSAFWDDPQIIIPNKPEWEKCYTDVEIAFGDDGKIGYVVQYWNGKEIHLNCKEPGSPVIRSVHRMNLEMEVRIKD